MAARCSSGVLADDVSYGVGTEVDAAGRGEKGSGTTYAASCAPLFGDGLSGRCGCVSPLPAERSLQASGDFVLRRLTSSSSDTANFVSLFTRCSARGVGVVVLLPLVLFVATPMTTVMMIWDADSRAQRVASRLH